MNRYMERNEIALRTGENIVVNPGANTNKLLECRMNSKKYPRIKNIPQEEALSRMGAIVLNAFQLKGMTSDPTNIMSIASKVLEYLLADYDGIGSGNISFEEIERVVERYVMTRGRDMFGVSASTIYPIIDDYIRGEGRLLQEKANELEKKRHDMELKGSIIAPMLQSYTGALVKNSR